MNVLDVVARFEITPDKIQEFKQHASTALEVCRTKDTGTLAYEWFLNDAQTEGFVLESYAGTDGVLSHRRNVGPVVGKILEVASCSVDGYGNAEPELVQALSGRKFMPRLQGLPNAVRNSREQPATTIRAVARFKIHPGQADEFKRHAADCMQTATSLDKGTLAYEWFMDAAGTECVVIEAYKDGDALLEHAKNGGRQIGKLLKMSDIDMNMFGDPGAEVLAVLKGMPTRVFKRFQGLRN